MHPIKSRLTVINILRWLARLWGLVLALVAVGEIISPDVIEPVPLIGRIPLFLFFMGLVVGFLLAWRWELWGGLVYVASYLYFMFLSFLDTGSAGTVADWLLAAGIFAGPGFLFLLCYGLSQLQGGEKSDLAY